MTVGERIKARRKELGVSADKLAEAVGVCRSTIFRYENNFIAKNPIQVLVPIARALNTTVGYLMGWDDDKDAPIVPDNERSLEVMKCFESLSDSKKREALSYLRYLAASEDMQ